MDAPPIPQRPAGRGTSNTGADDRTGRNERAVLRYCAQVPAEFRADVETWVSALRRCGQRPGRPRAWITVRTYLSFALPVLHSWHAAGIESLREVSDGDVREALRDHPGNSPHNVHTALRSLFGGL